MDDFSDAPESITTIKARKSMDGSLWTPRDAVVEWLRDYDKGLIKDCDALIISYRHKKEDDEHFSVTFTQSSKDNQVVIGLLEQVKIKICLA